MWSGHGKLPWITCLCWLAVSALPVAEVQARSAARPTIPVETFGGGSPSGGEHIVRYTTRQAMTQAIAGQSAASSAPSAAPSDSWPSLNAYVATLSGEEVTRLLSDPAVLSVEPNSLVRATTDQSNPPWGLDRIDQQTLPLDHTYSFDSTGAGVTAYVVDSGIRTTHTEFTGRIVRAATVESEEGDVEDCNGHGTHIAGILGGSTYGVAKNVSFVPVKVLSCGGSAYISTVIDGIEWIVRDHPAGAPAVANLSLEGAASPALDAAIEELIDDGVTVVVAAGNDGLNTCDYSPARVGAAITVGASESDDHVADYSNYGPCNDLFAPGTNVSSAWAASDTARATLSGTSMATPHVAGAVARLLEREPSLSPAAVWARLDAELATGELTGTFGGDPNKLLYLVGKPTASEPRSLTGTRGNRQVTLSWSYPADDSGSPITDYVVAFRTGGDAWQTFADGVSTAPTATVTGLVNGRCYEFRVAAVNALGTGRMSGRTWLTPAARGFTALDSLRLFDTRLDQPDGAAVVEKARYGGSRLFKVNVSGTAGVPSEGVAAVLLNVTVVDPAGPGYATVYPCGVQPPTSTINFATGRTTANAVITALSPFGEICIYSSAEADLVADVEGWFPEAVGFNAMTPTRLFDTRPDQPQGVLAVDQHRYGELRVRLASSAGIPDSGVAAVSLNVTAVDPAGSGFVTVHPCGAMPLASNLNFAPHQTVSNAVVAPVSSDGEICLFSSVDAHLVADINGWFAAGSTFTPVMPDRVFDTRAAQPQAAVSIPKQRTGELRVKVSGVGGVPQTGVSAVSLNVTAVDPAGPGFVTVYPCGTRPLTSNLNFTAAQVVPNVVIAPVSATGEVCFYASADTDLVVDVSGWYASS